MRTSPWGAGPRGRAPRISSNGARRSASTSRGPNRTRSCSRTRCWARGPTATATSSTSARRSPDACRRGSAPRRAAARQRRVPARGRRAGPPAPRRDHAHVRRPHRRGCAPAPTCPSSSGSPPNGRGSAEGAGRRRGVVRRGRDVPRGGDHARGADAGGRARRERGRARGTSSRRDGLRAACDELTTVADGPIAAVSVGHAASVRDRSSSGSRRPCGDDPPAVPLYANTGRDVAAPAGALADLARAGVTVVTGHVHLHHADPARHRRARDDQLGEVGLVRAREPRLRRRVRLDGRVRPLGVARPRLARPRPVGS